MAKTGRPIAKNIDYFPHQCKDDKELIYIRLKFGSEGFEVYYRTQQSLGDADYHFIDLKDELQKSMLYMTMQVKPEVVDGVIETLVALNWLDKELYQQHKILWSDAFMDSIRAVYINRIRKDPTRRIPTKQDIYRYSTCRNKSIVEYSIEKDSIEEKSKEDDTLLSFDEYQNDYPDKDVNKSLKKMFLFVDKPTDSKARSWLDQEMKTKPKKFREGANNNFIAYCSKCGGKQFPDKYQVKQGSTCCRVEYTNEKPTDKKV